MLPTSSLKTSSFVLQKKNKKSRISLHSRRRPFHCVTYPDAVPGGKTPDDVSRATKGVEGPAVGIRRRIGCAELEPVQVVGIGGPPARLSVGKGDKLVGVVGCRDYGKRH